ncbi:SDR family oxidoreductase [Shimia sp. R9_1]|uniref:SDR family NAD(P)-dependent oxidoreductase n=1 Tax=Shimia sp. R9_1 TaxID=2821111 RepID=UPI001ADA1D63|nr:SDR family oxidoreductase [Shimia sp. R9_1]MBO9409270.1 SDR family oxidoreductase [Shimia sp. R9_1]
MSDQEFNSRRAFLTGGGIVLAGAAMAGAAAANTLNPAEPATTANSEGRFQGKVVAITGGNSGIGKATADAFAMEGAKVYITARRDALGKQVEAEIRAKGGDVTWMVTDVRDPAQVERFIATIVSEAGRLDVLFNNAGIFMTPALIEDIPVEEFQDHMATNVEGVFYGMKYAIPQMKAQGGGAIINMASVAGHRGFGFTGHYSASKHAVRGLTKAGANVSAKDNIRINSISPLAVDTPMLQESFDYQGVTYEGMAPNFVTPRIMTPHEMAVGVMFLASDEASSINGTDLDATGGQLA